MYNLKYNLQAATERSWAIFLSYVWQTMRMFRWCRGL